MSSPALQQRRPVPPGLLHLLLLLGTMARRHVQVAERRLDGAVCHLVAELPDSLAGQERRETTGDTAYGAAWGDPAIVVTCGVGEPAGYDLGASCVQVDDAGWYVPDEVLAAAAEGDEDVDVTATELNYRPRVELRLPADYRPDGFGNAIGALTQVISREFERTGRCR